MIEQHVCNLGTGLDLLWLLSAASAYMKSRRDPSTLAASNAETADSIIALFSKLCWAQRHRSISFGLSDTQFACYVKQVHQVCQNVGQVLGGTPRTNTTYAVNKTQSMSVNLE
jgi:hypothetical protein